MSTKFKIVFIILAIIAIIVGMSIAKQQNINTSVNNSVKNIENQLMTDEGDIDSNDLNIIENNVYNSAIQNDLTTFVINKCNEKPVGAISSSQFYIKSMHLIYILINAYPDNTQLQNIKDQIDKETQDFENNNTNDDTEDTTSSENSDTDLSTGSEKDEGLQLISDKSVDGKIIGTIKNLTDEPYRYVEVNINLYDADGNQVDNTLANMNNLEANGTWNFTAYIVGDNVAKYRIINIEGNR